MEAARTGFEQTTPRMLVGVIEILRNPASHLYYRATDYTYTTDDKDELAEHCRMLCYAEVL